MQAWRNFGGDVREVTVDIGLDGNPILPPDTTVNPKPEALTGHYVTVVNNDWVQIEIPVQVITFESKKAKKLAELAMYRDWYLDQPVEVNGVKFDADTKARTNLTQALVIYTSLAYLPPAWITFDNGVYPLATIDDLKAIVATVQTQFSAKFFECSTKRQAIYDAVDEAALDAVVVPSVQFNGLV